VSGLRLAGEAGRRDDRLASLRATLLVGLGVIAFSLAFVLLDGAYYRLAAPRFPAVGQSAWLATLWGVVSRAHLLALLVPLGLWRPRLLGFQVGGTWQHWRWLLGLLLVNCGVIAAYLWLARSSTPYSGNQWLVTEVITVPLVEETLWRGLVFAVVLGALRRWHAPAASRHLAVWFSGLAFGLLHAANLLAGVPATFVAFQTLNAVVWGVAYGYARARTGSVYPPMLLHGAMNLVVVLF
jgi:membrane protease YdiL (CAAX protease family)